MWNEFGRNKISWTRMFDWLPKKPIQQFLICEHLYTEMKKRDQQNTGQLYFFMKMSY